MRKGPVLPDRYNKSLVDILNVTHLKVKLNKIVVSVIKQFFHSLLSTVVLR